MTKEAGDAIADTVASLTFNKVRIEKKAHSAPDFLWVWTPWTYHFGSGGWVFLNASWLWRAWKEGNRQAMIRRGRYRLDKDGNVR